MWDTFRPVKKRSGKRKKIIPRLMVANAVRRSVTKADTTLNLYFFKIKPGFPSDDRKELPDLKAKNPG